MQSGKIHDFTADIYKIVAEYDETGVFEWDLLTDEVKCDANLYKLLGWVFQSQSFSQSLADPKYLHPDDIKGMQEFIDFILKPHNRLADQEYICKLKYRFKHKDGKYVWLKTLFIAYFRGNTAYKVIGSVQNIDRQQQRTEKLKIEAERDSLTGLYNKRYVQKAIDALLTKPEEQHALLVIDLDGFKDVNDTFGHLFGDAVITDAAMTITNVFRQTDIVGRIGGDEFIVFMRNITAVEVIEKKCSMLCQSLRKSFETGQGDEKINISASIGVAFYPQHGLTFDEIFVNADTALYNSKFKGRDLYSFYESSMGNCEQHEVDDVDLFNSRSFREHAIEFVFNLLYETRDVNTTIDMMLGLIGRHFKLSRVFIYTTESPLSFSHNLFEWTSDDSVAPASRVYSQELLNIVRSRYRESSYGLFSECSDVRQLDSEEQLYLSQADVKAFLHCQICDQHNKIGCIGFDDCTATHLWSKHEHEVLSVFARILGYFLLRQMKIDELLNENERLHSVLDRGFANICVIDKTTQELLYMNMPLLAKLTNDRHSCKCYDVMLHSSSCREDCLLKELNETDHAQRRNVVDTTGTYCYDIDAYNIDWQQGADAALLIFRINHVAAPAKKGGVADEH